jgi:hypothetical protein
MRFSARLNEPVVLISSNEEDVPFDLKHIRVIYYDVTDPFRSEKLIEKVAKISARLSPTRKRQCSKERSIGDLAKQANRTNIPVSSWRPVGLALVEQALPKNPPQADAPPRSGSR